MSCGRILIVDDESINRMILGTQLRHLGYETVEAADGHAAVEEVRRKRPDIVFMDIMMPGMDGFEATRRIKAEVGEVYLPVIFLTALSAEEHMIRALDVGGDDFLIKPVSYAMLQARLNAVERVRHLNRSLAKQAELMRRDEQLAEELFSGVITAQNDAMEKFGVLSLPAMTFSGDLLLSARSPSGELHVLMGDFTGHGLYAAIGAMPLSQIFHSMTAKGYGPLSILGEMNRKLYEMLPAEMFCAACLASISPDVRTLQIWNGGLPDALLVREDRIHARFPSTSLPLGITENLLDSEMCHLSLEAGDRLLLMTDGVTEARNAEGEMFGSQRVEAALQGGTPRNSPFARLLIQLEAFTDGQEQQDDISLVCVPCDASLAVQAEEGTSTPPRQLAGTSERQHWSLTYRFEGVTLRAIDPVPLIVNQIKELYGGDPDPHLFTVLSELYNNAVDHGLLCLESEQKGNADGFANYLLEREARLADLQQGHVVVTVSAQAENEGGLRLNLVVEDSGAGFDYPVVRARLQRNAGTALSGRGLLMVERLCESLTVHPPGNRVEVVYRL